VLFRSVGKPNNFVGSSTSITGQYKNDINNFYHKNTNTVVSGGRKEALKILKHIKDFKHYERDRKYITRLTRAEKVYAFFNFYLYLFQRTMVAVLKKIGGSKKVPGQVSLAAADSNKQSSPSVLRDFPFPPPHGAYPHYLNELKAWRPSSWLKKLESVPHMKTVGFCTTQFNPLLSLFGAIIPKWGTRIHAFTRKTERKLGGIAFFRMIGLNTVMILKKVD
jgi:hypothetical protein